MDRFSAQNMADCEFCPPDGRRFRTTRQCAGCGRFLCLICRPWVPQASHLCPDCDGAPAVRALTNPAAAMEQLQAAGHAIPFWLTMVHERTVARHVAVEDEIVPE